MRESKTDVAGVGRALLTSKPLQVAELVGVFFVGVASTILSGLAMFGDGTVASI